MLEANRTRSIEGSTDDQVDIERWVRSVIDTCRMFPIEDGQMTRGEKVRTPVPEKSGENEGLLRTGSKRKRSRAVNIEALKKRCKGFQEAYKNLTAVNEELQKAKDAAVSECERLMDENKGLREEAAAATTDIERLMSENESLQEILEAEKKRADEAERESDEVHSMIARKRRVFEAEKLQHEALTWELDVYRTIWQDPTSIIAIKRASKLVDEFNVHREEEESIFQEIREFVRNGAPNISTSSSKDNASDSEPTIESLNRRIADQRTQITLLEMRLAKANAERVTDTDQAILDLGFQLDDALEELQIAYKDRTAADIARDDALAQVGRLETKIRMLKRGMVGSKQASAFSAATYSAVTRVLGSIREEEEEDDEANIKKAGSDKKVDMSGKSLAAELEGHLEDLGSDMTTRLTLDDRESGIILEKYNTLVMDNARLLEDGARLQRRIQHLEDQADRVHGARMLVPQKEGRVAKARIQELEKLISSQLDFHRDIRVLLASTEVAGIELHNVEADVLQRLEIPREAGAKIEALLEKISHGGGDDADIQEAREARHALHRALQGVGRAGGMKLQRKWLEFNKENGKLAKFVEDARGRLQDGARRLGIKVYAAPNSAQTSSPETNVSQRPEAPDDTMAEALATSIDTYLSSVLVPLGQPHLFRTVLTSLPSFLKSHIEPYFHVTTFILAALCALAGVLPAHFPRLRSRDVRRVFWHIAVIALLQAYIALVRERHLWLYANARVTSAYLRDWQTETFQRWSWAVDPRFMVFWPEIW